MNNYAGADWLQENIEAWNRLNPQKPPKRLGELGKRVADFLGQWEYGIYHLDYKALLRVDWNNERFIEIAISYKTLSTCDFDNLTRLVFLAHQTALRVEIMPLSPRSLKFLFHGRQNNDLTDRHTYHPTLSEAVKRFSQQVEQ